MCHNNSLLYASASLCYSQFIIFSETGVLIAFAQFRLGTLWSICTNTKASSSWLLKSRKSSQFVSMSAKSNRYISIQKMLCTVQCCRNAAGVLHFVSRRRSGPWLSCFAAHLGSESVNKVTVPSAHVDREKGVRLASRSPGLFQTVTYWSS